MNSSFQSFYRLPENLYTSQQVRAGEQEAAQHLQLAMYTLMERAGQAVFDLLVERYPDARSILICCGRGNNGGDGYIVGGLAIKAGFQVLLWQIGEASSLSGDAKRAMEAFVAAGGEIHAPCNEIPESIDVIIDGLLGTGITGEVRPFYAHLIDRINQACCPILSIDTPSGLDTDTGALLGHTVKADSTISFIGLKRGLVTGKARVYTGVLCFAGLGVEHVFDDLNTSNVILSQPNWLEQLLPRERDAHKGSHGRALVVGSGSGMSGACYLASAAALRAGAGLVAVQCHEDSAMAIRSLLPEAMVSSHNSLSLQSRLDWCSGVALGMGLGRDKWGGKVYEQVINTVSEKELPCVLDADALYWLSKEYYPLNTLHSIITPHPGEAAMLLGCSVAEIEKDRFEAIRKLQARYGGIVVLKGAGTLVDNGKNTVVCHAGNPGMAAGGTGDLLAGTILALLIGGYSAFHSAVLGTLIHSLAADQEALRYGETGMLASDMLPGIRQFANNRLFNSESK
ncbi:NAD(P)H-hydrate dehydratase [Vibrio parahaemolyticus]|uniref:NAD(P)H-hydrate dehydratase n=1 Tax=Vibrio mediterranei TaxID=689 RepID=UPI004067966D